jgi:hypothetical protein
MNAFAKPEEASNYEYPEFPAPPREEIQFPVAEGVSPGGFVSFEESQNIPPEEVSTTVQTAVFQDFKQVLPRV